MSNVIKDDLRRAKNDYVCDDCKKPIAKGENYNYLFGSASVDEKPYVLRMCFECK